MSLEAVPIPQMDHAGATDARKTDRVLVHRQIRLRTSDQREFTATCTDVNLSGIGIDTERVLRVGQRLELILDTRTGEQHLVPLLVIYRMAQHYGLSALGGLNQLLELLPLNS